MTFFGSNMNNLNLIIDDKTSNKTLKKICNFNPSNILILDLGKNDKFINKLQDLIKDKSEIHIIDLNVNKINSSKKLHKDYINFISNISNLKIFYKNKSLSLKNFLYFDDLAYWWLTTISEKNPLKRNTFFKINILYSLISSINKYNFDNLLIDIEDREISSALVRNLKDSLKILQYRKSYNEFIYLIFALINSSRLFFKLFFRSMLSKFILINKKISTNNYNFTFISTYRNLNTDNEKNPYFETLIDGMRDDKTSYKNLFMLDGFNIKKNISDLISLKKSTNANFDVIDRYIKFADIFSLMQKFALLANKQSYIRDSLKENAVFLEIDIYDLLIGDIFISFAGQTAIDNLYKNILFREYFSKNLNDKKILYPLEMQAWEKIMNTNKNKFSPKIKTYGIQHVPISFLMLNYFYTDSELIQDHIARMPLPDKALLFSKNDLNFFESMGWPKERLKNFGSIRFQKFIKISKTSWSSKQNIVAVVLPGDKKQSVELINFLYTLINENIEFNFLITHHPQIGRFSKKVATKITNLENCSNSELSTDELARKAKAMITYGSSAVISGILNLCKVIIPILPTSLPLDPAFNKLDIVSYIDDELLIKDILIKLFLSKDIPDDLLDIFNKKSDFINLRNINLYIEDLQK